MDILPLSCDNCRFYNKGNCQRFPPQVWADETSLSQSFPQVSEDSWCGEYKRKEAVQLMPKQQKE